ncbi:MAG: ABC transporter substrate-binding protein [Spirochaetales bacterium]|nr:ABC transporter substrate-binding protein [Spirochaetales bacterium]
MPERLRVLLDWKLDAKHAVFVEGRDSGDYARRGLEVELVEPAAKSIQALQILHSGAVELAINYPHNLLLSREDYPGLVSVGALVRHNPEGILSLAARPVAAPADLRGRSVGIGPSPVSRAQFEVFCQANGIDRDSMRVVTVGFEGEELLLSGRIDALDGVAYAIARTRRKGHEVAFLPYAGFGIPDSPFLVFAARREWAEANAPAVRDFLEVSAAAFRRVCAWGRAEWGRYATGIPGREAEEEREVWEATRPLIEGSGRLFEHDLEALAGLQRILRERGLPAPKVEPAEIFWNRFVPEPG